MKFIKMTYLTITVMMNFIFAVLLILSSYAYLISPVRMMFPSYLGLAFPVFLFANVLFIVFWLLQRRWLFLLSLITLFICFPEVKLYTPLHRGEEISITGDSLVILSYNVECFQGLKPHLDNKPNEILEYIANSRADIICMQEFAFGRDKSIISEVQINQALEDYPYHYFSDKSKNPYSGSGIACYSKYPIIEVQEIVYESVYNSSYLYRIQYKGRELTIINNHLESNKFTLGDRALYRRMLKHFEPELIGEFKNRLVPKLDIAYIQRAVQAEKVSHAIQQEGDNNIIVCGDFNDTPQSYVYHKIRSKLKDAYVETGFGPGITYHKNGFLFRIDHILYSGNFHAVATEIGKLKNSDHYPLKATFVWDDTITSSD